MRRALSLLAAGSLVWSAAIVLAPAASATTACNGTITTNVNDSVTVAAGADCAVFGATVTGSIVVQPGGSLILVGAQVNQNVVANAARFIAIGDCGEFGGCPGTKATVVTGSVSVTGTTSVPGFPTTNVICDGTQILGSLSLSANKAPFKVGTGADCFYTPGSAVFGSMAVTGNSAAVTLTQVSIKNTLSCSGNTPAPTDGGGNTATTKVGQCSAFGGGVS